MAKEFLTFTPDTHRVLAKMAKERRLRPTTQETRTLSERPPSFLRAFYCQPQTDLSGPECSTESGDPGTVKLSGANAWILERDPTTNTLKYARDQNGDRITKKVWNLSARKIEGSTNSIEEGGTFEVAHAIEEYLHHDLIVMHSFRLTCGSASGSGSGGSGSGGGGSGGSGGGEPAVCISTIDGAPLSDLEIVSDPDYALGVKGGCMVLIPVGPCTTTPGGSGSGSGSG